MTKNVFVFQHLQTTDDVEEYLQLVRSIWTEEVGVDRLAKRLIDEHPEMSLKNFFVIRHKGMMVSTLNLIPVVWSIGGVRLKVAEMGYVGTLLEHRGSGLIRRLVDEYHKQVELQDFDLSVIEGIPFFYRQFGYEYAVPLLEETRIRLDQIPDFKSAMHQEMRIRELREEDVSDAAKLLEQSQRKFYVCSFRNANVWRMQEKSHIASDPEPFQGFAVEENGKLIAYFRVRENRAEKTLILSEISEVDLSAAQAICNFLKEYGIRKEMVTLSANISYEEPFADFLMSLGGVQRTPYAWQIRITDYVGILKKLAPLFKNRLAGSLYYRLTEKLRFDLRTFRIELDVQDGKIANVQQVDGSERSPIGLNPFAFVQLLMGYRSREELESTVPDVRVALTHKHLVDVLFPKLPSYIHSAY